MNVIDRSKDYQWANAELLTLFEKGEKQYLTSHGGEMTEMKWEEITDRSEWDSFVDRATFSSIFHTWSWRNVLESEGLQPLYLGARSTTGQLLAACPFCNVRINSLARIADSLPYSDLSGPLVSDESDASIIIPSLRKSLLMFLPKFIVAARIRIDNPSLATAMASYGYRYTTGSGYFLLDLESTVPQAIWNGLGGDQRTQIRWFDKAGAQISLARTQAECAEFARLYRETMDRKRYSALSHQFIAKIRSNLPTEFKTMLLSLGGVTYAAMSFFADSTRNTVHAAYIGYDRNLGNKSSTLYLVWQMIRWTHENGYRFVNLGNTSSNPSNRAFLFKHQFGGQFVRRYCFTMPLFPQIYGLGKSLTGYLKATGA